MKVAPITLVLDRLVIMVSGDRTPMETVMLLADPDSQMHSEWVLHICTQKRWKPADTFLLSMAQASRGARNWYGQPIHSTIQGSHQVKWQLLLFRTQGEQPSCSALGTHECAEAQRESPQPKPFGRKMKAMMGQCPERGRTGQPSNNTPSSSPVWIGHPVYPTTGTMYSESC